MKPDTYDLDLGNDHWLTFSRWSPDRKLFPQYDHLPDVERYGAIFQHIRANGTLCACTLTFAGPVQQEVALDKTAWEVVSHEPLTLSPSIVCHCGDHGFIRNGKWESV